MMVFDTRTGTTYIFSDGKYSQVGQGDGYTVGTYSVNDGEPASIPIHKTINLDSSATT